MNKNIAAQLNEELEQGISYAVVLGSFLGLVIILSLTLRYWDQLNTLLR